jgi:NAD(P)-dependent dehydrogenase (short-subunit alcohol dehydrogenase family)
MPPSDRYLKGHHAIVTGAGRGIGAAIATELARLGANVTLLGRDQQRLDAHADAVAKSHDVETAVVRCDVAVEGDVKEAFRVARETFGPPYVLVNNAGQAMAAPLVDTSRADWDRMLAVNLTGPFHCMREALPAMIAARAGRVVNVASMSGLKAYSHIAAYVASKHGVVGLTRAAALEVAKHGITVNAVCPGYTDTDMAQQGVDNLMKSGKTEAEARAMILRTIPRGSLITPEEVAATVGFLCGPAAAAITGETILVSGGELA